MVLVNILGKLHEEGNENQKAQTRGQLKKKRNSILFAFCCNYLLVSNDKKCQRISES